MVTESEPGSPLSEVGSDMLSDLEETYVKHHRSNENSHSDMSDHDSDVNSHAASIIAPQAHARPKKRRRLDMPADHATPLSGTNLARSPSPVGSISSDSTSSIPHSPSHAHLPLTHPLSTAYVASQKSPNDPDHPDLPPPSTCLWEPCDETQHANLDDLVGHINNMHIMTQKKKFYCAWRDCTRKDIIHTSAYALRAHVRSHTKEKPFMCVVPECDRSFTRSDALAKHMRTVHETEVLWTMHEEEKAKQQRLSKTMNGTSTARNGTQPVNGTKKIKLTFKNKPNGESKTEPILEGTMPQLPTVATHRLPAAQLQKDEEDDRALYGAVDMDSVPFELPSDGSYWPRDFYNELDDYERNLPPSQLFRLMRRQIKWASDESNRLDVELSQLRTQTDDEKGRTIHESDTGVSIADLITAKEWRFADTIMTKILQQELKNARLNGDVEGDDPVLDKMQIDGEEEARVDSIWQQLKRTKLHGRGQEKAE